MNKCSLFLAALLCSISHSVTASSPYETQAGDLRWHGLVSQGLVYTTENQYFGNSEEVSFNFHDVAVGVAWQPRPSVLVSGQLKYRQAGEMTRDRPFIDYALVDYLAFQTFETQAGIRVGRIKNRFGFYNDIRDVAATRASVLLSNSTYRSKYEDITLSSDAVSVYATHYFDNWLLTFDVVSGYPVVSDQAESEILAAPLSGDIEDIHGTFTRIMAEGLNGHLKLAYSRAMADWDYEPNPGTRTISLLPGLDIEVPRYGYPGSMDISLHAWSVELDFERWQITSERLQTKYELPTYLDQGSRIRLHQWGTIIH